ncbi:WSC domain-containing protein [Podospora didyma]|uniref:WSC domain-containing protein n=1 Tax=Podospora didyma TaxID=330526 RepID=A0AAE0NT90_9PEZI|nr:WSC domain-containing protein [Podospora didyma]
MMASTPLSLRLLSLLPLFLLASSPVSARPSKCKPNVPAPASLTDATYLGCFVDSGNPRVLPDNLVSTLDMTAAKCAVNCAGYDYFGTQRGSECYCGNTAPVDAAPAAECNMVCTGNDKELCGGSSRLNVYAFKKASTSSAASSSSTVAPSSSSTSEVVSASESSVVSVSTSASSEIVSASESSIVPASTSSEVGASSTSASASSQIVSTSTAEISSTSESSLTSALSSTSTSEVVSTSESPAVSSSASSEVVSVSLSTTTETPSSPASSEIASASASASTMTEVSSSSPSSTIPSTSSSASSEIASASVPASTAIEISSSSSTSSVLSTSSSASSEIVSASASTTSDAPSSSSSSASSSVPSTSFVPSSTSTTIASTSTTPQGPPLTTITTCPGTTTVAGPAQCYQSALPASCEKFSSMPANFNSRLLSASLLSCRNQLTQYGNAANPTATACFPTSVPANPANVDVATSTLLSVYSCLQTANVICSYNADCKTATYTVGQVPSPTPSIGVDLLLDGGFESGTYGSWSVPQSPNVPTELSTQNPHTGSWGYHVRYANINGGSTVLSRVILGIEPSRQYRLNAWLRHDNAGAATNFYLYAYPLGGSTPAGEAGLGASLPVNTWTQRSITFTAVSSWFQLQVSAGGQVVGNTGTAAGVDNIWIDDITLTRLN